MTAIVRHARANAIAYVALFVALGGTSYAAFSLPAGSVGAKQIRNHAITPVKFNGSAINGSVRAWAVVGSGGKVLAGGGRPKVGPPPIPGSYEIRWGVQLSANCATTATVDGDHSPTTERIAVQGNSSFPVTAGYAVADSSPGRAGRGITFVTTFDQDGKLAPLGFDLSVVC